MKYDKGHPAAFRTWIRQYLPWFMVDFGIADKIENCEKKGGWHYWYNIDNKSSGCYHCKIIREGRLWENGNKS